MQLARDNDRWISPIAFRGQLCAPVGKPPSGDAGTVAGLWRATGSGGDDGDRRHVHRGDKVALFETNRDSRQSCHMKARKARKTRNCKECQAIPSLCSWRARVPSKYSSMH